MVLMTQDEAKERVKSGENPGSVSVDHWQRMYDYVEELGKIPDNLPITSRTCGLCISARLLSGLAGCGGCTFVEVHGVSCLSQTEIIINYPDGVPGSHVRFLSYMQEMIDKLKEVEEYLTPAETAQERGDGN